MIEMPRQDPCDICETLAGRSAVPVLAESELTVTVVNPMQFESGQCCVRRGASEGRRAQRQR